MNSRKTFKRVAAGTLALLTVAVYSTANVGGALPTNNAIVAVAADVNSNGSANVTTLRVGDKIYKGATINHPANANTYNTTYTIHYDGQTHAITANRTWVLLTYVYNNLTPFTADDDYQVVDVQGNDYYLAKIINANNTSLESTKLPYSTTSTKRADGVAKAPVVKRGEVTLTKGVDYNVTSGTGSAVYGGQYSFTIEGIGAYRGTATLNWEIEQIPESTSAIIKTNGMLHVDIVASTGTLSYTKDQLARLEKPLTVNKGETVIVTMEHKTLFTYFYGNETDKVIAAQEIDNKDGTYTYTFVAPGYDIDHNYVTRKIKESEIVVDGTTVDEAVSSITATDENGGYYPYTAIKIVSANKLVITSAAEAFEANEVITEGTNGANIYTYTFAMPDADVNVALYDHDHKYVYTAEGGKLYRQCTFEDGECGQENKSLVVAALSNARAGAAEAFAYDGTSKETNIVFSNDFIDENAEVKYFFINRDGLEEELVGSPTKAGTYIAKATVTVNNNGSEQLFDLKIDYTIDPLGTDRWTVIGKNDGNANAAYADDAIVDADYIVVDLGENLEYDENDIVLVEGEDYYVLGTDATRKPGNYSFTVEGIGNYSGSVDVDWAVVSKDITANGMKVEVGTAYLNGYAYATVEITDAAGKKLHQSTDFRLGGERRSKEAGTYIVEIQGTGEYTGTIDAEWTADSISIANVRLTEAVFNPNTETVSVSLKREVVSGVTEYGVFVSRDGEIAATASPEDALAALKTGSYIKTNAATPDTTTSYKVNINDGTASYMWVAGYAVIDGETVYTGAQLVNIAAVKAGAKIAENYENDGKAVFVLKRNDFDGVEGMGLIVARNNEIAIDADPADAAAVLTGNGSTLVKAESTNYASTTSFKVNVTNRENVEYIWAIGYVKINGVTTYTDAYQVVFSN